MTRPTGLLLFAAAAFTIGLLLPGFELGWGWRLAVVLLLFLAVLLLRKSPVTHPRLLVLSLALLWSSLGWLSSAEKQYEYPSGEVWIEGRVRVPVEQYDGSTRIRLDLDRWVAGETAGHLPGGAVLKIRGNPQISAGETVRFIGQFLPLTGPRNPGGFDERAWWGMRGVQTRIIRIKSLEKQGVHGLTGNISAFIERMRNSTERVIDRYGDKQTIPLTRALLLGDRTGWDGETRDRLARSGLMHLFAISGLHVGLLWGILVSLLLLLRVPRLAISLISLLLLWVYVPFTAANPPVLRAAIIVTIFTLGRLLQRQNRIGHSFAIAWIVLLAFHPKSLTDVGFLLTFAGSIGSIAAGSLFKELTLPGQDRYLPKFIRGARKMVRTVSYSLAISFGAMLMSMPIVIFFFGRVPWFGPIVTVLAVPLLVGILITGWGMVLLAWLPWLPGLLGDAHWALIRLLDLLAGTSSSWLPVSEFLPLSSAVAAGIVAMLLLFYAARLKQLGWIGVVAALLIVGNGVIWSTAWMPDNRVKVGILDVGQGDGILIKQGRRGILIDGGRGFRGVTLDQIRLSGLKKLDLVLLTHGDEDHAGAVTQIVRSLPIGAAVIGPGTRQDRSGDRAVRAMLAEEIPVFTGNQGGIIQLGSMGTLSILSPSEAAANSPSRDDNDRSLVILWEFKGAAALFPGDAGEKIEQILLDGGQLPDIDLLLAGHHGSRFATTAEWLAALQPEVVAISSGRGNPYGHPATELMDRLDDCGVEIHRTDREGAILLTVEDGRFRSLATTDWW